MKKILLTTLIMALLASSSFAATFVGMGLGFLGHSSKAFNETYSSNAVPSINFEMVDATSGFGLKTQVSAYNNVDKNNEKHISYVPIDMSILYHFNPMGKRTFYIGGGLSSIMVNEAQGETFIIEKGAISAVNFLVGMTFYKRTKGRVYLEYLARTGFIDNPTYSNENIGSWQVTMGASWNVTPYQ